MPLYRSHDLRPGPPGPGRRAERPAAPPPRRRPDAGDPPGDPGRAGRHEPGGAELRADRGPRLCRQGLALPPLEHPGRTALRSPHRPRLRLRRPPPQPRTGSLRTDLVRLLGAFADALDRPHGRALRPLLAQRARHPELYAEVYRRVVLPHKEILLGVLGAAVERGEAGPGALGVRTAATAPRLVIAAHMEHGTVPRDEVEALVDEVLMPLFTAGGGGNVPGPEERSTMGA
ncbi:TetR-like C-terminal domain-containing protein [Streptomyces sp. NA13]|uniref:TetR-like C-terminal domain-containing protein n=2 Tax=unclassified Streptomyces TaxID=2593676 RepID=UPI002D1E4526|nr:TetR-like C-terminal domain-containing protein [Streptomyces sp. NA13]